MLDKLPHTRSPPLPFPLSLHSSSLSLSPQFALIPRCRRRVPPAEGTVTESKSWLSYYIFTAVRVLQRVSPRFRIKLLLLVSSLCSLFFHLQTQINVTGLQRMMRGKDQTCFGLQLVQLYFSWFTVNVRGFLSRVVVRAHVEVSDYVQNAA